VNSTPSSEYRADIDGLRAVAVLCVVAFHGFPRIVGGGFIGVDIFFVVSGFLISGIIYDALRRDRFSYLDFYARRIRRIFPALLTVLAACIVAGWFLLLPDEYRQLGRQTAAGAGFAANILFWSQAGYFDWDSTTKPLLHLWSLGIEEQFYLVWPLFIAFLYKRTRYLPLVVGGLMLGSFVWNIGSIHGNPTAAFYLPMARFWELLSGATLSYLTMFGSGGFIRAVTQRPAGTHRSAEQTLTSEILAWSGLLLIAASLMLITTASAFPGWWALLPSAGTILLIAARDAWLNRVVLSNRVLVFVGLISYPLYLWHWVLLAILRIRLHEDGAEAPRPERIAVVALSFLLAWLTYQLIEKPIRFGVKNLFRPVALLVLMVLVGAVGYSIDVSNGADFRYPLEIRPLAAFQYDSAHARAETLYRADTCFLGYGQAFADIRAECIDRPDGNSTLMVLWGDSHAASLYPGLKAQQGKTGGFRLAQFTASACPPVLGQEFSLRDSCKAFNDAAIEKISALKPDTVVMEGNWRFYILGSSGWNKLDFARLQATISRLQMIGVRRIVVFGNLPVWKISQPKVGMMVWRDTHKLSDRTRSYFNDASVAADSSIRAAVSRTGAVFVSPIDALCNEAGCLLSADPSKAAPVAWDAAHLSEAGSKLLISKVAGKIIGN
jgi:peptidoglycan/LPS O-acetylase OafA/YrhL